MLDWIKIESNLKKDPRIQNLLAEYEYSGLGLYLDLRLTIESINKDGIPLGVAIASCDTFARKNKIKRLINDFGLFSVSESGIVTVNPIETPSHAPAQVSAQPSALTHATPHDTQCAHPCVPAYTPAYTSEQTSAYTPAQTPTHSSRKEEKEKKRREEIFFIKPTIDEIEQYCYQRQNYIDPEFFFNFYEARGWMTGKNKMTDWKAVIRYWESNPNF